MNNYKINKINYDYCFPRNGWSAFNKRRTAVAKINSLRDATEEEIAKHNDVCAICYQDMTTAKITRCKHMFHAICLRKWLYMQVRGRERKRFEFYNENM